MRRLCGSAIALNASEVVAARAMAREHIPIWECLSIASRKAAATEAAFSRYQPKASAKSSGKSMVIGIGCPRGCHEIDLLNSSPGSSLDRQRDTKRAFASTIQYSGTPLDRYSSRFTW
jgi:hypothetical protein